MRNNLPKVRLSANTENYEKLIDILKEYKLNTVCQEANCPNIFHCFSQGTLTFMILGNICTRNCSYCNVKKGKPLPPDKDEPKRIANVVKELGLRYVVITCVTRDDLEDGGAGIFADTVREIKTMDSQIRVEVLISDLGGNWSALEKIVNACPEVIGHNIEVVKEFFPQARPQGDYDISIKLLKKIKECNPNLITKSGLMVGLGETEGQIIDTMEDIRDAGCDIITIGQYLAPSQMHFPVNKFYSPEEFSFLKETAEYMGFREVQSDALVRSSFNAHKSYRNVRNKICLV